jgi:hypothetical protein
MSTTTSARHRGKKRPAYERMLADIREGRVGAVVCWHLDRLHRQPIELERFVELADTHRVALATVTGDVDLSTDDGRFMARIMGAVARKEIERKRARQLRAAQQKAEQGRPQWRKAFGYLDDGSHQPDPVTAPLVAEAYRAVLAGGSISDIARLERHRCARADRETVEPVDCLAVPAGAAQRGVAFTWRGDCRQGHLAAASRRTDVAGSAGRTERAGPGAGPQDGEATPADWCAAVRQAGVRWLPVGALHPPVRGEAQRSSVCAMNDCQVASFPASRSSACALGSP